MQSDRRPAASPAPFAESWAEEGAPDKVLPLLTGAGATFPYPIYSRWAHTYELASQVKLKYQPVGSSAGISQIKKGDVDFGASDAPMNVDELYLAQLVQFPMVVGGVVPVVNLKGLDPGQLQLTPELLVRIFLGQIDRWDDPALAAVNPELALPSIPIKTAHRSDGSGTNWIFTKYLARISDEWESRVDSGKSVVWPTGTGGKGNEGIAAYVMGVEGAVGYVELAHALQNEMPYVRLRNRSGNFVLPTSESFQAAAESADWQQAPGFYLELIDQPGENTWPITGASFILIRARQPDRDHARRLLRFFDWCYTDGAGAARELHYVPMPPRIVQLVRKAWREGVTSGGEPVWP